MGLGCPLISRVLSSKSNGPLLSDFVRFNEFPYIRQHSTKAATTNFPCRLREKRTEVRRVYARNIGFPTVRQETYIFAHNAMPDYLGLSEAWESIPRFDGDKPDDATNLIDAFKNVKGKIDPAHEEDLLESILNTKIQGTAAIVLQRNGVTTFKELIVQLRKLYPREVQLPNSCFLNCRHERIRSTGPGTTYSAGYGYFASYERAAYDEPCIIVVAEVTSETTSLCGRNGTISIKAHYRRGGKYI